MEFNAEKEPEKLYNIVETHCYPACWKVVRVGNYNPDNATHLYHRYIEGAINQIESFGGELQKVVPLPNDF